MSQVRMLFPAFDLIKPLFVCDAFRDDAAGSTPVVKRDNLRYIRGRRLTQHERLRCALFRFGDQRKRNSATVFQFESVFIAELTIEVGNASYGLDKISLRLAAFVDQLEKSANESAMAIRRISRNHLRATNAE